MRVTKLGVENFRLLRDVTVSLDTDSTVLVGRNDSGKTSLAEFVSRSLSKSEPHFGIADFSIPAYGSFLEALVAFRESDDVAARTKLPKIELRIEIEYEAESGEFGPLAPFILDLDETCNQAVVVVRYELADGRLGDLFKSVDAEVTAEGPNAEAFEQLANVVPKFYERSVIAVDPNDSENRQIRSIDELRGLVKVDFLTAQRGLDDEKSRPRELLAETLEALYLAAAQSSEGTKRKDVADELVDAVTDVEQRLDAGVKKMVEEILPTLSHFGYPGLGGQQIQTRTSLEIERLLGHHTSVHYAAAPGVALPETYSGLGTRNLVFMLFSLLQRFRKFSVRGDTPGIHLILLEEPEAHLHPQMQEVFIEKLASLKRILPEKEENVVGWPAQFIVSTHSSHVANQAQFDSIRYFKRTPSEQKSSAFETEVKDLGGKEAADAEMDANFLHQYLTLTRSDLFFADRAILVEGTSERILVPAIINKLEQADEKVTLSSAYVATIEVGGAYAHLFLPLLKFLGLRSLVVTDIDAVGALDGGKRRASAVHAGERTSNASIKHWFGKPDASPMELVELVESDEAIAGTVRICTQVPEKPDGACGRTLEDSFSLANPVLFDIDLGGSVDEVEAAAMDAVAGASKSSFAIKYAIDETEWTPPRYLSEGLKWLADEPSVEPAEQAESTVTAGS